MKSNLFYSLFKYRSTIDRDPLEDYFTELLGFLFNNDSELAAEWVNHVTKGTAQPDSRSMKVFTQFSLGKFGRADLVFHWVENDITNSLIMEHKIGSSVGERGREASGEIKTQVANYLCYQMERGAPKDHRVAIFKASPLTLFRYRHHSDPYFLGEFTWDSLYKFLVRFVKSKSKTTSGGVTQFICKQILAFMRRYNMTFENFTVQELASLSPYKEFREKRNKLAERIIMAFKAPPKDIKKVLGFASQVWGEDKVGRHYGLILHSKKKRDESHIWVHIGFSMLSEEERWWTQYWPQITLKDQGIPDIQVMLVLYPEDENGENVKRSYGNILEKLNAHLPKDLGFGERFEMIVTKKSLCLLFRKPLSDFLRCEDQESEVIKFLEIGLNAMKRLAKDELLLKIAGDDNFRE